VRPFGKGIDRRICLALWLWASVAHAAATLQPGDHDVRLSFGGRVRRYVVHMPLHADGKTPLPLVLAFHDGGGTAQGQKRWSGLDAVADREGFLAVYPDGTARGGGRQLTWNAGACCGYAQAQHVDDVGFVVAVLGDLAARTPVDRTRVYATGMSNGAMLAYRLAVEASDRIAAIAPVAGAMVVDAFAPTRPMPVMHVHSIDDPRAPYAGGARWNLRSLTRIEHAAVEATIRKWVEYDGCPLAPRVDPPMHGTSDAPDARHTATRLAYGPCRAGTEVVLWKLTGAGHVWPGAPQTGAEWWLGPPTRVIDATSEMWRFFRRFTRPDAPPLAR